MDYDEAGRKVAALIGIIQTMMPAVYTCSGKRSAREWFDRQVEEDELLAMAIARELSEEELAHAFGWADAAFGSHDDEIAASPVLPHVPADERTRARVALLALEEADNAHTLAVRAPAERPGGPPLTVDERVQLGEEVFLGRIEIDVLHAHAGWSDFMSMAEGNRTERLERLPEPWRKHAKRRVPELRARLEDTLGQRADGRRDH